MIDKLSATTEGRERPGDVPRSLQRVVTWCDRLLNGRRLRVYPIFMLVIGIVFYAASNAAGHPPFDAFGHPVAVDLSSHLTGGRLILDGKAQQLYDVKTQWAVQQRMLGGGHPEFLDLFISPPFVALVYLPLSALPYEQAAALWTALTVLLLIVDLRLIWPLVPNLHHHGFSFVLIVALSSWPVIELIADGQDSALMWLFLVGGLRLLLAGRDTLAGGVLGLGAAKPQLFLLIPVFLVLQRRWRALAAWLAVAIVLGMLSAALVTTDGIRPYVELLTSKQLHQGIAQSQNFKMLTLLALCQTVLGGPAESAATPATIGIDLAVLGLFLRSAYRPSTSMSHFTLVYGMSILAGSLVSPHFLVYDGVTLFLPALLLLDRMPDRASVRLSLAAAYVLTWTAALRSAAFGHMPWPISLLAAPWTVLSVAALLLIYHQVLSTRCRCEVVRDPTDQ